MSNHYLLHVHAPGAHGFSLHHRITYWVRTCTLEETEEMATHVEFCIMEEVQVATGVNFDAEVMAKERLRLPARMKGG